MFTLFWGDIMKIKNKNWWKYFIIGGLSGAANGLFGAGGGLFLVPLLLNWIKMDSKKAFATSVAIIFPISIASLIIFLLKGNTVFSTALPFLIGGILGGFFSGKIFHRIPTIWLHRLFGILILYGAVRTVFF